MSKKNNHILPNALASWIQDEWLWETDGHRAHGSHFPGLTGHGPRGDMLNALWSALPEDGREVPESYGYLGTPFATRGDLTGWGIFLDDAHLWIERGGTRKAPTLRRRDRNPMHVIGLYLRGQDGVTVNRMELERLAKDAVKAWRAIPQATRPSTPVMDIPGHVREGYGWDARYIRDALAHVAIPRQRAVTLCLDKSGEVFPDALVLRTSKYTAIVMPCRK